MLDPLRVAPAHLRQDADRLVPARPAAGAGGAGLGDGASSAPSTASAARRASRAASEVVRALAEGDAVDAQVGKALDVYARSGLTQLGFADPDVQLRAVGHRQVTYLPIRDLPAPEPGTPRSEYSQAERVGEQIVRLIAMFAMHLMGAERERLKLFSFDEGWRLLGDPVGRTLLSSLQRMGRSELAVPIISTQLVTDALIGERESLENLLGATFVFGMRSEAEAGARSRCLASTPTTARCARRLLELRRRRCLFRDHRGRVEAIQVDLVAPRAADGRSRRPPRRLSARSRRQAARRRSLLGASPGLAALGGAPAPSRAVRAAHPDRAQLARAPGPAAQLPKYRSRGGSARDSGIRWSATDSAARSAAAALATALSAPPRRNCATSGFVASAAPTGNYGSTYTSTPVCSGSARASLMSILQDLLVTPVWMALVWSSTPSA